MPPRSRSTFKKGCVGPSQETELTGLSTVDTFSGVESVINETNSNWVLLENVTSLDRVKPDKLKLDISQPDLVRAS